MPIRESSDNSRPVFQFCLCGSGICLSVLIKLKKIDIRIELERDKIGSKVYYEKLLTEIMGKLERFPTRLSLEEQGKFDLGYYHQMQKKYEKKEEK